MQRSYFGRRWLLKFCEVHFAVGGAQAAQVELKMPDQDSGHERALAAAKIFENSAAEGTFDGIPYSFQSGR
jgi:hypothetical protein